MMFWALARVSFRAAKIVSCNKNFFFMVYLRNYFNCPYIIFSVKPLPPATQIPICLASEISEISPTDQKLSSAAPLAGPSVQLFQQIAQKKRGKMVNIFFLDLPRPKKNHCNVDYEGMIQLKTRLYLHSRLHGAYEGMVFSCIIIELKTIPSWAPHVYSRQNVSFDIRAPSLDRQARSLDPQALQDT
jgi:hypothetical protein